MDDKTDIPPRWRELIDSVDLDKVWENLENNVLPGIIQGSHPSKLDDHSIRNYKNYNNPLYQRGMFIQTTCEKADVHNYHEMKGLLESLALKYHRDTKLIPIGQSLGYEHPSNALDIWSLQLPATQNSEHTAFFVSGHHYHELSGPETVYEIANRILASYSQGNPNVQKMRQSTHLVFIPQIDVDAYNNLETALRLGKDEFYLQGYSRFLDPTLPRAVVEYNAEVIDCHEFNYYEFKEEDLEEMVSYPIFDPSKPLKNAIVNITTKYGNPCLAIDYHEQRSSNTEDNLPKFMVLSIHPRAPPLYIYAEIAKSYPVMRRQEIRRIEEELLPAQVDWQTFSDYLAHLRSNSYVCEPPSTAIDLHQRIEMNLIATDRILARHYLGI